MTITTPFDDTSDKRWRQRPLGYATSSRREAAQAHIVFAVVFTLTGWLAVQLPSTRWRRRLGSPAEDDRPRRG